VEYNVNGKMIPFQQIVFPIKSENQIHGIAGININISDRIKYQNELLDYQIQLKEFAAHLQTVREEERVDLAREIHDDLGQILVAIKFDLGMLGVKSKKFIRDEAVEEFSKQFKRLEGYVNNTIKSARRIMTDLRPELLDMVGLVEAFKEHINAFNERQSINCEFINKTTGVDLPPEKAVALFRILQESLNNAAKYSEATKVTVELGSMDKTTYLDITDNGVGFDLSIKKRNDSYGLTGMKERAYLLDGKVDIWSEPGKGVKIKVEVPE
jgi:signal transduction histidine kinase